MIPTNKVFIVFHLIAFIMLFSCLFSCNFQLPDSYVQIASDTTHFTDTDSIPIRVYLFLPDNIDSVLLEFDTDSTHAISMKRYKIDPRREETIFLTFSNIFNQYGKKKITAHALIENNWHIFNSLTVHIQGRPPIITYESSDITCREYERTQLYVKAESAGSITWKKKKKKEQNH